MCVISHLQIFSLKKINIFKIVKMKVDSEQFFSLTRNFPDLSFHQSEGSYLQKKSGKEVFFVNNQASPTVGCFGTVYKSIGIKILRINSLCYNNPTENDLVDFLKSLCPLYDIIDLNDENAYNPYIEKSFRLAGYRKPLGQFRTDLTIIVYFDDVLKYDRSWKHNIKSANAIPDISCEEITELTDEVIDSVARLFKENSIQKKLSYSYTEKDLTAWMSDSKFHLYVVRLNDEIIAARIVMANGIKSYDVATANGAKTRNVRGVTHYLVDNIFNNLKEKGIKSFDFSCLPIGRKGAEGVCEFKQGIKSGRLVQYNGPWIYTKHNYQRWILYFINKHIRKVYEY